MNYESIRGYFDFEEVYDEFASRSKDGDFIVEVGSFLGKSACYLAQRIKDSGKDVTLLCVDKWPTSWTSEGGVTTDQPFENFTSNVRQCGLSNYIVPIRTSSKLASKLLCNDLSAVFIDASHVYDDVKDDIACWKPKIREGGLIAGHDFGNTYPGVAKAVKEAFKNFRVIHQSWIAQL